jgi:hypothetical protein
MLKGTDTGHAWRRATPDARRTLCRQLAAQLGRDEEFLVAALESLYESGDRGVLDSSIEGMARISVAAMHMRPPQLRRT